MPKTFLNYKGAILASVYETDEIVANPTLEGTEQPLEGLEVGNVKYKVSGGTGGTSSVFSDTDFDSLVGKHLSVDKLIALLKSKNIIEGYEFYILGGMVDNGGINPAYGIHFEYGSDTVFSILDNRPIYSVSYDTDYETTLLNAKTAIESIIIKRYGYNAIYNNCIRNRDGEHTITYTITLQEFLDLFEE